MPLVLICLAQGDSSVATPTTIVGAFIAVTLALAGLLGWVIRHLFITTIPGLLGDATTLRAAHEKVVAQLVTDQATQREIHRVMIMDLANVFRSETLAERSLCKEQFAAVNASLAALVAVIGQDRQATIAAINQHTTQAMAEYRHDLADKIQQAVLGRDLHLARKLAEEKGQPHAT